MYMQLHSLYSSTSLLGNMYLAITKVFSSEGVHGDLCFPFLRYLHCYHCLLGGTVDCHRDCIRSCYSCVILAELQAETEGYARSHGWHRNECFNMQLPSAGSPFLFQSLDKGAPPPLPLPLLFFPKALTASSSNQIQATVQWKGPISDNAIAACLSRCTYVSQRNNTVLY